MKRKAVVDLDGESDVKKEQKVEKDASSSLLLDAQDLGHRRGNFHNYYAFHPSSHRLTKMSEILKYIGEKTSSDNKVFEYCDLGCNEGDLTIKIASALQEQLKQNVHFVGIDIDPVLIGRAKRKPLENDNVTGDFSVGNICERLAEILDEKDSNVDMTSLLSTTMWIHIHAGDEGLRTVLEQMCQKTKQFLLIEPQPSKCYRKAQKRLRKMGRPEVDVSPQRLKLRQNIEQEIDSILQANGFRNLSFDTPSEKTQWNRELQLYERM